MPLSRWTMIVGALVALGCLTVTQRNAIYLQGYGVGTRVSRIHAQETDVAWLQTSILGLHSPTHLAGIAAQRQLSLTAWSQLPPAGGLPLLPADAVASDAPAPRSGDGVRTVASLAQPEPSLTDDLAE